eukprot:57894-Amphidinium_carterae.1
MRSRCKMRTCIDFETKEPKVSGGSLNSLGTWHATKGQCASLRRVGPQPQGTQRRGLRIVQASPQG